MENKSQSQVQQSITRHQVTVEFIGLVAEQMVLDDDDVTAATRFREDMGADSLDHMEIVMAAENHFGIVILDEEVEGIKTVGEMVNYICRRLCIGD